jgi:hypothetical protein
VASRRPRDPRTAGLPAPAAPPIAALLRPAAALHPAANDNKAPLPVRLRRLLFLLIAAAATGWMFWAGLLR